MLRIKILVNAIFIESDFLDNNKSLPPLVIFVMTLTCDNKSMNLHTIHIIFTYEANMAMIKIIVSGYSLNSTIFLYNLKYLKQKFKK